MPKRLLLFYLPIVVVLFSCVLALPQEVTEPVASVTENEPTPVPLDQATSTTAFDVLDTPVPTATSAPSATPTTVVVSPTNEDGGEVNYVLLYSEGQIWEGQPRSIDQPYKILSLEQDALRGTTISGDPTPIDFGLGVNAFIQSVSPNGRYVLLSEPWSMISTKPYLFDQKDQTIKPLLFNQSHLPGRLMDWSVDSQKFLYWVDETRPGLWLVDLISEKNIWLAPGAEVRQASISPSGDYVVFLSSAGSMIRLRKFAPEEYGLTKLSLADFGVTENERYDDFLWVVESKGGIPRRILDYEVSVKDLVGWSSEGLLINYFPYSYNPKSYNPPPPNVGPLWVIDLDGQKQRNFVSSSNFLPFGGTLSPDRTKLAFLKSEAAPLGCSVIEDNLAKIRCEDSKYSIYVIDLRQDEFIKIGSTSTEGWYPAWSPDSKQLGFTSHQNGQPEIWVAQADGSEVRLIRTSNKDHYLDPSIFWLRK